MTYFTKQAFRKKWNFRKSEPRTFTKIPKIYCIGQKHLSDKLEAADFKCDNK